MRNKMEENKKLEELTFEEIMNMLDKKTKEVQEGNLDLDKSIKTYEEGMKLVEIANTRLDNAEKKIVAIKRNDEGQEEEEEL